MAVTLEEALTGAYENNDQIQTNQGQFLLEIEQFSQALAGFMPKISASVTHSDNKIKAPGGPASLSYKQLQKQLNVTQPVFSGGSSVAALKAAQSAFRVSRGKYYAAEQNALLSIIQSYMQCYSAKEKYGIAETSLINNQKQLEAVEERLKVGEATETDRANAAAAFAGAEASKLIAYANLQTAKANFFSLTGIEAQDITLPDLPENLPKEFDEIMNKARIKNFDLEQVRNSTMYYKANEGVSKAALLPQVNLSVSAGSNKVPQGVAGAAQNSLTTAVSVNIPIYAQGGAEYSAIRSAKKQTRLQVITLDQTIKSVNAHCIGSWQSFEAQKSSINAYTEAVIAAQIAYDGTMQEEMVGSKTILDVLIALDNLNKAKIQKVDGLVQYVTSAYQLKQLMGELTAKSLKLKVNYFNPENEFKKSKIRIIGF
jgi:outer membrane protein